MNVVIRLASESDAGTLARLRYELRSMSQQVVEDEQKFLGRCESWMMERLRSGGLWRCWIAEREARAVGAVWAQLVEKIPNPTGESESYVYLTNFYVLEEYRSIGIGSQLLAAVLEWSRGQHAQTVILWPTEVSKRFYQRHGFTLADDLITRNVL
ncbi:MAG TPA: GNAT family N-acetyltransferase [Pyrinomonadaceae bacterium]|nr:GNAT family N-acetyltransferase [Pyrinomonadaceae bacterium]